MSKSRADALEEVITKLRGYANQSGAASAQFYAMGSHGMSIDCEEKSAVLNRAADLLSSSAARSASGSPTIPPTGMERWREIWWEELDRLDVVATAVQDRVAISAIRRSVEEALEGAAATRLEGEKT